MGVRVSGGKRCSPSDLMHDPPGRPTAGPDLSHRVPREYRIPRPEEARLPTALPTAASPSPTTFDQVAS